MTVPDVRVTSVRRTVGVAVALVTGQALLCGIIGVVTFGGENTPAPGAPAVEPQLAGPPVVVPPRSTPPAEPVRHPEPGSTSSGRIERPPAPPASPAVRSSATRTIVPSRTVSAPPPAAPVTSPPGLGLLPPSPVPSSSAPKENAPPPVVLWERCDDEGATAETVDGQAVRCTRGRDGDLRWRRV